MRLLIQFQPKLYVTVCSCHVTYTFQSESTLYSCLNVKERLAQSSSIVLEGIRAVFFSYQDILHKYKTHKYLSTPKKHNKPHSLGKKCPDNPADKKIINNFLFKKKM